MVVHTFNQPMGGKARGFSSKARHGGLCLLPQNQEAEVEGLQTQDEWKPWNDSNSKPGERRGR